MSHPIAVLVGGALGALARWAIAEALAVTGSGWPTATFVANLAGAFGLGVAAAFLLEHRGANDRTRALVVTGFFGALTTFSTFAVEGIRLIEAGRESLAAAYWLSTLIGGQALLILGVALGRARKGGSELGPLEEERLEYGDEG